MTADGKCPKCGAHVAEPTPAPDDEKAPWHFKLLVVAVVLYLGWRIVDIFN